MLAAFFCYSSFRLAIPIETNQGGGILCCLFVFLRRYKNLVSDAKIEASFNESGFYAGIFKSPFSIFRPARFEHNSPVYLRSEYSLFIGFASKISLPFLHSVGDTFCFHFTKEATRGRWRHKLWDIRYMEKKPVKSHGFYSTAGTLWLAIAGLPLKLNKQTTQPFHCHCHHNLPRFSDPREFRDIFANLFPFSHKRPEERAKNSKQLHYWALQPGFVKKSSSKNEPKLGGTGTANSPGFSGWLISKNICTANSKAPENSLIWFATHHLEEILSKQRLFLVGRYTGHLLKKRRRGHFYGVIEDNVRPWAVMCCTSL